MEEPVVSGMEITPPGEQTPPVETFLEPSDLTLDPGQLEGKPKHEPPVGSPRWNEVYHKAKETERTLEAERAEKAGMAAKMAELQEQNRQFSERMRQPQIPMAPPQYQPPAPQPQQQIDPNTLLQQMKAARAEAYRDMDMEKIAKVQDDIDSLIVQMSKPDPQQIMGQYQAMEQAKELNRFSQTVPWFGVNKLDGTTNPDYDPIMEGAAINLERQLMPSWRGSYQDLLSEVKRQVETRLMKPPVLRPAIPGVGGVGGVIPPSQPQTTLTPDEQRVARLMFGTYANPEKAYLDAKGVR